MILTKRAEINGCSYIEAVLEYFIVDDKGAVEYTGGNVIVCELEVVRGGYGSILYLIRHVLAKHKSVKKCMFIREYKYKDRAVRSYDRGQFERLVK
jgi:hypothetical protein